MHDKEALEMMNRCLSELSMLRDEIGRLAPKADAYDSIATILGMLPKPSRGACMDLVWTLKKRIREIEESAAPKPPEQASQP